MQCRRILLHTLELGWVLDMYEMTKDILAKTLWYIPIVSTDSGRATLALLHASAPTSFLSFSYPSYIILHYRSPTATHTYTYSIIIMMIEYDN